MSYNRIQKDDVGHVLVQYKRLSTDEEWHPKFEERPLEIFKIDSNGDQITPEGSPDPVPQTMDLDDLRDLKR